MRWTWIIEANLMHPFGMRQLLDTTRQMVLMIYRWVRSKYDKVCLYLSVLAFEKETGGTLRPDICLHVYRDSK
jgi:hypothetical protein